MTTNAPASDVSPATPDDAAGVYSHRQILTILTGLLLGMFLASLDQTIVSTSIRTIADDLHGLSAQAWVTTAYLVTSTVTTPIYGKLGDLWGRKRIFMFAISVFIVGSALCSFATSMPQLAAFRAFQGLGAGGLMTLVMAIVGDIVSPRERAKYTGYFMAVFGSSSVLGPVVGGFLAGTESILGIAGWRWVFLVNVPIGVVALLVVFRTLKVTQVRRSARVDVLGALALFVCLVPLLTVAEQGRVWGWDSGRSIGCFALGAVGLALFIAIESRMGVDALIPFGIFKIRAAAVTLGASVIVGIAMFGVMMLLPLYLQIVRGASPTQSGIMMLPMVAGMMTASMLTGRIISRTGKTRIFPILGSSIVTVGLVLFAHVSADTPMGVVMAMMFLTGYGIGNCMQPLILIAQSAVPPSSIGVATAGATFFRQIGGTLGVAVFLSVVFGTVQGNISDEFASAQTTPAFQAAAATAMQAPETSLDHRLVVGDKSVLAGLSDDSSVINHMDKVLAHPIKAGFADSITSVFWIASGFAFLALLVLLLMPSIELWTQSAAAAVAAESAT